MGSVSRSQCELQLGIESVSPGSWGHFRRLFSSHRTVLIANQNFVLHYSLRSTRLCGDLHHEPGHPLLQFGGPSGSRVHRAGQLKPSQRVVSISSGSRFVASACFHMLFSTGRADMIWQLVGRVEHGHDLERDRGTPDRSSSAACSVQINTPGQGPWPRH